MPRQDQENRNDSGFYKPRYGEPLSKVYGVSLFASDEEKIKAIAQQRGMTPTELIRQIVREWLLLSETPSLNILRNDAKDNIYKESLTALELTPLESQVWESYQRQNNKIKPTALELNRQPEQIRQIVARVKRKIRGGGNGF